MTIGQYLYMKIGYHYQERAKYENEHYMYWEHHGAMSMCQQLLNVIPQETLNTRIKENQT